MTVFTSTFEVGDLSEWTGSIGAPSINSTTFHCGAYAVNLTTSKALYKDTSAVDELFERVYIRFSAIGTSGESEIAGFSNGWDTYLAAVTIRDPGDSSAHFEIHTYTDTHYQSDIIPVVDTWYCVEFAFKKAVAGYFKLWIDGTLKVNQSVDTSGYNQVNKIWFGNYNFGSCSFTAVGDCVVVDSSYIGVESSGYKPGSRSGMLNATMGALLAGRLYSP